MPIKSFRGKLAHGGQKTIRLSTTNGLIGYRIKKFQLMSVDPSEAVENVAQIYTRSPAAIDGNVNFNDPLVLAAAMLWQSTSQSSVHESIIIFDNTTVNQDIFITNYDVQTAASVNYYLELEQIKLAKDEAAVATLKDMRGTN